MSGCANDQGFSTDLSAPNPGEDGTVPEAEGDDPVDDPTSGVPYNPFDLSGAVVAVVTGWQCRDRDGGGDGVDVEIDAVTDLLLGLGVGTVDVLDEDEDGLDPATSLVGYDAALYTRCGWAWQPYNGPSIAALEEARAAGTGVFVFGDDSAFRMDDLPDPELGEDLVGLSPTDDNGSSATLTMAGSSHEAYSGRFGTPTDIVYNWDIDKADLARERSDVEVEVLAWRNSGSRPTWLARSYQDGGRTVTLLASIAEANHGDAGDADALSQLEIVFSNSLVWVGRL